MAPIALDTPARPSDAMQATLQDTLPRANALVPAAALDEDGFLHDGAAWSRELAEALAFEAGIDALSPAHWQLIGGVRERYHRLGCLPVTACP
jgi:hypothetical protein